MESGSVKLFTKTQKQKMLEKTEGTIKNGQSRKNWQHWAYKTKRSKTKNTTQYVLVTIIRKQTQIT
jgi:hypothetical protein